MNNTANTELHVFRNAVHVLNGDMLLHQLQALEPEAEYIVMRECLVEGAVINSSPSELFTLRATELESRYGVAPGDYELKTVDELERISSIPADRQVILWFENDLFCQTNLWFVSTLFDATTHPKLSRVFPNSDRSGWSTFSIQSTEELQQCFASRLAYSADDLRLSQQCWAAYCKNDAQFLREIAKADNPLFQQFDILAELIEFRQSVDIRESALAKKIKELPSFHQRHFSAIFADFQKQHPIYGFGDLQLKNVYEALIRA